MQWRQVTCFCKVGGKKRTFKTREVLGDYDDQCLIEWHRLDRHLIENVFELVRCDLEIPTKRNKAVSVSIYRLEKFGFRAMTFS